MDLTLLTPVGRIFLLALGGFIFFHFLPRGDRALRLLVSLTMRFFLPLYFIRNFITGWSDAKETGITFIFAFFFGSILFLLLQIGLSFLTSRISCRDQRNRKSFMLLFSFHNAGYMALPVMESFAPPELMIFMFFWIFGFSSFFWILAPPIIRGSFDRESFRISGPLVGIIIGFLLSVSGLYEPLIPLAEGALTFPAQLGRDLVIVCLGGVLAMVPLDHFHFHRDFIFLLVLKLLIYPLAFLLVLKVFPLSMVPPHLMFPIHLALILQASVPPSTNLMIAVKKYGTTEQIAYIAAGEMVSYPFSIISIPLILTIASFVL
jgi:malate permease and related proteins